MTGADPRPRAPGETYRVDPGGALVRSVVPKRGKPYEHRCDLDVLEAIAHAIDERGGQPFVMEELKAAEDAPWTQAAVALAFLKERGCVAPADGRRSVAASGCVHLDAMVEYHALRHDGREMGPTPADSD